METRRYRFLDIAGVEELEGPVLDGAVRDAVFGGADEVGAAYAVLDAARIEALEDHLEGSGLEHRCLYTGRAFEEFRSFGPWLVRLEEDNDFVVKLFTQDRSPFTYWGTEFGIFVRTELGFDALWRHLRRFLKLRSGGSEMTYFRFYDPVTLRSVVAHLDAGAFADFSDGITRFSAPCPEGLFVLDATRPLALDSAEPGVRHVDRYFTPRVRSIYAAERRRQFVTICVDFLERHFPGEVARLTGADRRAVAETAIAHAQERGIDGEGELLKYLIGVMVWGSYFEQDPHLRGEMCAAGWVTADGDPLPHAYLDAVLEQAADWRAVADRDLDDLRTLFGGLAGLRRDAHVLFDDPARAAERVRAIWRHRASRWQPSVHREGVATLMAYAARRGLAEADAVLCAGLAPLFGQGFLHDPRFPWVTAAVAAARTDPAAFLPMVEDGLKATMFGGVP